MSALFETPRRGIIFDMDGLLLDSEAPICDAWVKVTQARGYASTPAHFLEVVGRTETDAREIFFGHFGPGIPLEAIRREVAEQLEQTLPPSGFAVKPGAFALLDFLQSHTVPVGVATSTARSLAVDRLRRAGLLPYFQAVTAGDEVSRGKPEPDIFLLAAQRLSLPPERCLVLEDSSFGALGARAAGMAVMVVPDLKQPIDEVRRFALGIPASLELALPAIAQWLGFPDSSAPVSP